MDKKKLNALQPFELHKELLDKYLEYCKFVDLKKFVDPWVEKLAYGNYYLRCSVLDVKNVISILYRKIISLYGKKMTKFSLGSRNWLRSIMTSCSKNIVFVTWVYIKSLRLVIYKYSSILSINKFILGISLHNILKIKD